MRKLARASFCAAALLLAVAPSAQAATDAVYAIEPQYDYANHFSEGLAAVVLDGKVGFIDRTGKQFVKPQYDNAESFYGGLAAVIANDKWGYIDDAGRTIVEPRYEYSANFFKQGLSWVQQNGKYGFVSRTGAVIPPQYDRFTYTNDVLIWVKQGDYIGFLDRRTGDVVVKPQYRQAATYFAEGLLSVQARNGYWGFIDATGREAIKPQEWIVSGFSEGLAAVQIEGRRSGWKYGYIDRSGRQTIAPQYDEAGKFSGGLALVKKDGKYGFIDRMGQEVVKLRYDRVVQSHFEGVGYFSEGLSRVKRDGKYGFVDRSGAEVVPPQFDDVDSMYGDMKEGLALVKQDGRYGYVDNAGRIVVAPQYEDGTDFAGGLARVGVGGKWGYIDKTGRVVLEPRYDKAEELIEGLAIVAVGGKYGAIDAGGHEVVAPAYDDAERFGANLISVSANGKYGLIDKAGAVIVKPQFDRIGSLPDASGVASRSLAHVVQAGKIGYIDGNGKVIIEPQFDEAGDTHDGLGDFVEGLARVKKDGKWGYVANPLDVPAEWAAAEVGQAAALQLVPGAMAYGYADNIARADFSKLIVNLLSVRTNRSVDALLADRGVAINAKAFVDTADWAILAANALGIVGGKEEGRFDPAGNITRQEAAVMLTRAAKVLGVDTALAGASFADRAEVAGWAEEAVAYVSAAKDATNGAAVMGGTGGSAFSPTASYTRQQAFITMKRLFHAMEFN